MTDEYVNENDRTDESIMRTSSGKNIADNFLDEGQIRNYEFYPKKIF